jgi:tRNA-dihydrouridine synthase 1
MTVGNADLPSPPMPKKQKLGGYDFYRSIGSPKWVVAPMVDQSELVRRTLCLS